MGWDHPAGPAAEAPKLVEKQFWRAKKKICEVVFCKKGEKREISLSPRTNFSFCLSVCFLLFLCLYLTLTPEVHLSDCSRHV